MRNRNLVADHLTRRPIAVVISDIHYSIPTLEVADEALKLAVNMARKLRVRILVSGDLHDTKANMRAECVNRMMDTISSASLWPCVIVGNHDRVNEKSADSNALGFLKNIATVIDISQQHLGYTAVEDHTAKPLYMFAYHSDLKLLRSELDKIPRGSTVVMHQGLTGAAAGEYIQDKTAIRPEDVAGLRVISGHYHYRQDIPLPDDGLWTYLGNPYTLNFGESEDPEKGFHILYDTGEVEFIPTNLRRHVVYTIPGDTTLKHNYSDIVKVKVNGTREFIANVSKNKISKELGILQDFKLELIPEDEVFNQIKVSANLPQSEVLDGIIDALEADDAKKLRLKKLWRSIK